MWPRGTTTPDEEEEDVEEEEEVVVVEEEEGEGGPPRGERGERDSGDDIVFSRVVAIAIGPRGRSTPY